MEEIINTSKAEEAKGKTITGAQRELESKREAAISKGEIPKQRADKGEIPQTCSPLTTISY